MVTAADRCVCVNNPVRYATHTIGNTYYALKRLKFIWLTGVTRETVGYGCIVRPVNSYVHFTTNSLLLVRPEKENAVLSVENVCWKMKIKITNILVSLW